MKNQWATIDVRIGDADADGKADIWIVASLHGALFETQFELDFDDALAFAQQQIKALFEPKK